MSRPHHQCIKGCPRGYEQEAKASSDAGVRNLLHKFENEWKGSKPGGGYQTSRWRVYKRAFRNEAHRRGLGT